MRKYAAASERKMSIFERYLSLWVAACMALGLAVGMAFPGFVDWLRSMELGEGSQINIPIAVLIWLMIYPMMLKIDFASIRGVGRRPTEAEVASMLAALPQQPLHVAGVLTGHRELAGWWGKGRMADWSDAVEAARRVGQAYGVQLRVVASDLLPWHPGRCAELRVGDWPVGHAGELHPKVIEALGLPKRTVAFELDLDALPLDDRRSERFNPAIAGRPDLMGGRKSLTVYDGMTGIMENAFINVKGVAHSITAEVVVPDAGAEGVIIAQAGYFGGWALYLKDGKANHVYNFFGLEHTKVASDAALAPGEHTIHYEFTPDEAKPGTGGKSVLSIDGKVVAEGYIPKTQPFAFSADEGADVGIDGETVVTTDYRQGDNAFTGKIVKVTVAQL